MRSLHRISYSLGVLAALVFAPSLYAQDTGDGAQATGRPRVFFDCQGPQCDNTYYRTEIPWVNWVREPQDAQLYVIMTSQNTGAGGREYRLDFEGRGASESYVDQTLYQSLPTDTQREQLDGVTYALGVGFARFAQYAGFRDLVRIQAGPGAPAAPQGLVSSEEVQDPWNLWVFRINGNGNFNGESLQKNRQFQGGINASRVTPTWKQSYGGNVNYNYLERTLTSGSIFTDERTDFNLNGTVVYSLAPNWSLGFTSRVARDIRQNQRWSARVTPAIEYSFFPYEEATRRSLTAFYEIGPEYYDYYELTRDSLTTETRGLERLTIDFSQRQPWGDASVSLVGSHYLHDLSRHNVELRGNLSFRIMRGLDVNVGANYSFVSDQLYLPLADLTDEEILTGVRRIETSKQYGLFFGLSYQFGSIFNNVVNNRFPGGGGGFGGGGRGGGGGNFRGN